MQVPSWLWGSNPSAFFSAAKLRGRQLDKKSGLWRVQTDESWRKIRPSIIMVSHLAGPMSPRARFELLRYMTANDTALLATNETVIREINRLGRRVEETQSPVDALTHSQLRTMVVESTQLPEVVEDVYQNLLTVGVVDKPEEKVFRNSGVHVIKRSPELLHRLKVASVWLRIAADEKLRQGELNQVSAAAAAAETAFASSQGLYDGIYTLDAYLGPLLGSLSPAIWCFSAARMFGVVIYTLGQPIAGTQGVAAELLQVLPNQGAQEGTKIPTLSAGASSLAVSWWVERINGIFAVLADLAVFTNREGLYVPAKHLQAMLTVEQLFRRVFSIQASYRDTNARRTLLFTVLDTLERLTGRDLVTLCSLPFAQKTLRALKEDMGADAAEVLIPGAERAVAALKDLQDGFFILRHTGGAYVEWTDPRAGIQRLTIADAAAQYIKVLRDGTHGHGSNRENRVPRTNALLTHHDGHIPHDLGLLGYLYLLDLMTRPEDLRMALYGGGRT